VIILKRGQGSTEYLVILASVLIVSLVVISLLGWFPGVGGGARVSQSQSYWVGASPLSITGSKITPSGGQITIANRISTAINVTLVLFDGNAVNSTSFSLVGGQEQTISVNATCGSSSSGQPIQFSTVVFQYNQGGITGIKQTGSKPLVNTCS
jgi:hypothetical protein